MASLEKGTPQNTVVDDGAGMKLHGEDGGALGRTLTSDTQPAFPVYHRRLANPAPLGLFAFAATTLMLSLINVGAKGITIPNTVVGMAYGYGGLCQLLAGMWEFACGNTFGATAFSSYGGFWISYALINTPGTGIAAAYANEPASMFANTLGIYLEMWFIVTTLLFMGTFRASVALGVLFFTLALTFMLLGIAEFTGESSVQIAGGAFGIMSAATAFYTGAAGLYSPDVSYLILPIGDLPKLK